MQEEDRMGRFGATAILVLAGVLPAVAAELPTRKAGLWEVKMSFESRNGAGPAIQQCIDAATDQMMQSGAGPLAQAACSRRDVQKSGNTVTIDSACTVAGKAATSHAVITGSFESAYTMTVTSESATLPGGKMTMTMAAKWLGPCAADQKPGDMIMGNGFKMNILEMQKRGLSQGVPLPQ
jgi:formylglycine-generating enzyme required for sulfatase activity